ncbi:HAT, C-terminal dimerization domain containing protein [Trema orientale]|uniref:HAT, C-terminal dimerization domain containing protein n=1 Tax=Trema orientale TaxID=63057 RepID=A0A2P5EL31_TREOI|nr:HAT, C-terminal dimerization domain containing protein [Trema orientale]
MDKQRLEINVDDFESKSVDVPIDIDLDDENDGTGGGVEQQLKRKRRLTSQVWKYFEILSTGLDKTRNHRDVGQLLISQDSGLLSLGGSKFDVEKFRNMEFDDMSSDELGKCMQKSQLKLYLDEPRMARNVKLDVLAFWKSNQFRYPELAAIARDILSILVSTVASEVSFSVGGRVLDQYRTSLKPDTVEAIICLRDWMHGDKDKFEDDLNDVTQDVFKLSMNEEEPSSTACSNSVEV